jgi:DNA-binding transcriptional LysR family regulator
MGCDPRLLPSFVVLSEELHFLRAARRLHIAQPALSQQIKRLESQLGVRLFDRSRHSVELTDAGRALLIPARQALKATGALEDMARRVAGGEQGEVRLGLSPGAHYVAQELLARFRSERPQLAVSARTDNSAILVEAVASGELDLALGFCAEPAEGVVCDELLQERAVLAVGERHPLAGAGAVTLSELGEERFALVDERGGPGYNHAVHQLCRDCGFEPRLLADPQGPMAWETAVRRGACVGLTTRSAAQSTARGVRLIEVEPPSFFALQLVRAAAPTVQRPAAAALQRLARAMAASGELADEAAGSG